MGIKRCTLCRGKADNGHDRCDPPNAYICKRCNQHQEALDMANAAIDYLLPKLKSSPPHTQCDLEIVVGQLQMYVEKYTPIEE